MTETINDESSTVTEIVKKWPNYSRRATSSSPLGEWAGTLGSSSFFNEPKRASRSDHLPPLERCLQDMSMMGCFARMLKLHAAIFELFKIVESILTVREHFISFYTSFVHPLLCWGKKIEKYSKVTGKSKVGEKALLPSSTNWNFLLIVM